MSLENCQNIVMMTELLKEKFPYDKPVIHIKNILTLEDLVSCFFSSYILCWKHVMNQLQAKNNIYFIDLDTKENVEKRCLNYVILMKHWVGKFDWVINTFVSFCSSWKLIVSSTKAIFFLNWKLHSHSPSQSLVSLIENNCGRELLFNMFSFKVNLPTQCFYYDSHCINNCCWELLYNNILLLSVYSPIYLLEKCKI